jgi:hypothetical protein
VKKHKKKKKKRQASFLKKLHILGIFSILLFICTLFLTKNFTSVIKAATLFSDDFESDAIGSFPTGWSSSGGGTWAVAQDGTQVVNLSTAVSPTFRELVAGNVSWTDYTVTAQVKLTSQTLTGTAIGIAGRRQSASTSYMLFISEAAKWKIYKQVNSGWTLLGSGLYPASANTWYTLSLTFSGNNITGLINGVVVGSFIDNSITSGGISLISKGLTEYDNISVTSIVPSTITSTPTPTILFTPTPTPTATPVNGGLSVTSKIQNGISNFPNNQLETDISWVDGANNGWMFGLIPTYGGALNSPWYEITNGTDSITQTSLATTIPDGFLHLVTNRNFVYEGTESHPYTLSELAPSGTSFRRYFSAQEPANGPDANGFNWIIKEALYPGDPGFAFERVDLINPSPLPITLNGSDGFEYTMIGGLQQAGETVWNPGNGGYGIVGGANTVGWPTSQSIDPDYVYITPLSGSGITTGVVSVRKVTVGQALGATSPQLGFQQNSNRLKVGISASVSSIPANSTSVFYNLQVLRRNLTSSDAVSIAADYLNPDSPVMNVGVFNGFSYDDGMYQMTAANNQVQFTPTITGNVTERWINIYKVVNFTNQAITSIQIGGVTLTAGVDYLSFIDTTNQVSYIKIMRPIVPNGATGNQLNNGLITIQ